MPDFEFIDLTIDDGDPWDDDGNAAVTLDFACQGCHETASLEELSKFATGFHTEGQAFQNVGIQAPAHVRQGLRQLRAQVEQGDLSVRGRTKVPSFALLSRVC